MRQGSGSQWRIRSHLDCKTVSRRQVPGGSGADLIGNVAGGRPIKPGRWIGRAALAVLLPSWSVRAGALERSRLCTACRIGGAAVVEC